MQQETRREIVDRLLRFVGELNDADARSLAEDLAANALQAIWLAHPFTEFVMPVDTVVNTVASTATYVLPTYFGRVAGKEGIVRNLTLGQKIYPLSGGDLEEWHPELAGTLDTQTGIPQNYTLSGKVGIGVQVAAAGEALEALSSSSSDTDVYLEVEGLSSAGEWTTTQVTLTGVAPVALGTWTYVQTIAKAYQATVTPVSALTSSRGTVTVRKVSGAVTRQTLFAHEASREQYQFRLWQTPQSVYRIGIPTIRLPRRMFQDSDPVPALWGPALFEQMLIDWRVNRGELGLEAADALKKNGHQITALIGYDNESRPATRPRKTPFGIV